MLWSKFAVDAYIDAIYQLRELIMLITFERTGALCRRQGMLWSSSTCVAISARAHRVL